MPLNGGVTKGTFLYQQFLAELDSLIGRTVFDSCGREYEVTAFFDDGQTVRLESVVDPYFSSVHPLDFMLDHEDAEEDNGLDGDDRLTCHPCRTWATDAHCASNAHLLAVKSYVLDGLLDPASA